MDAEAIRRCAFDPMTEIVPLIGSKEGISHLALAYIEPGASAIIPEPGYNAYQGGTLLASGEPYRYALRPRTNFLIDLDEIPDDDAASHAHSLFELSEQPDGGDRAAATISSAWCAGAASSTSCSSTTTRTPSSRSTATCRRASSRSRARATWRSSSIRCPRRTT